MKNGFLLTCFLLLVCSCNSIFEMMGENVDVEGNVIAHDMIVLGDQLEDPYSVDVMTKALESVCPTKANRINMDPTHIYVRFLPEDDEDFDRLADMGVQMLDHPVDYEIVREGDYYHDPSIDEEKITWQYAVVEPDFACPSGIRYEVLDECYIPDDTGTKADGIDWEAVEREAYRLSGNASMLPPRTKADGTAPSGRVTIVDDDLNGAVEGVKGVTVSCNSFVKFGKAFTDENGNYEMTTRFTANPRYRLLFKNRLGFAIGFNKLLVPASTSTLGTNPPAGVDVEINSSSDRKMFTRCVVNNAGYDYYQQCKDSGTSAAIKTPPSNLRMWIFQGMDSSSTPMFQQGAIIDESFIHDYLKDYTFLVKLFFPDITLGVKGLTRYSDIYSTAIHELSHASHYMEVGNTYWNIYIKYIINSFVSSGFVTYGVGTEENHGYCEVGEIWAYYVQSKLFRERYGIEKSFGTSNWFTPQVLLTLDERGLNRYKIFQALLPTTTDMETFKKCLVSLYPEFKSAINQTFAMYD